MLFLLVGGEIYICCSTFQFEGLVVAESMTRSSRCLTGCSFLGDTDLLLHNNIGDANTPSIDNQSMS